MKLLFRWITWLMWFIFIVHIWHSYRRMTHQQTQEGPSQNCNSSWPSNPQQWSKCFRVVFGGLDWTGLDWSNLIKMNMGSVCCLMGLNGPRLVVMTQKKLWISIKHTLDLKTHTETWVSKTTWKWAFVFSSLASPLVCFALLP